MQYLISDFNLKKVGHCNCILLPKQLFILSNIQCRIIKHLLCSILPMLLDLSPVAKSYFSFQVSAREIYQQHIGSCNLCTSKKKKKKSSMIKCNKCNQWQHASFAGVKISNYNDKFKCGGDYKYNEAETYNKLPYSWILLINLAQAMHV